MLKEESVEEFYEKSLKDSQKKILGWLQEELLEELHPESLEDILKGSRNELHGRFPHKFQEVLL